MFCLECVASGGRLSASAIACCERHFHVGSGLACLMSGGQCLNSAWHYMGQKDVFFKWMVLTDLDLHLFSPSGPIVSPLSGSNCPTFRLLWGQGKTFIKMPGQSPAHSSLHVNSLLLQISQHPALLPYSAHLFQKASPDYLLGSSLDICPRNTSSPYTCLESRWYFWKHRFLFVC